MHHSLDVQPLNVHTLCRSHSSHYTLAQGSFEVHHLHTSLPVNQPFSSGSQTRIHLLSVWNKTNMISGKRRGIRLEARSLISQHPHECHRHHHHSHHHHHQHLHSPNMSSKFSFKLPQERGGISCRFVRENNFVCSVVYFLLWSWPTPSLNPLLLPLSLPPSLPLIPPPSPLIPFCEGNEI